jgi:Pentapeptide repeats (8 copies)
MIAGPRARLGCRGLPRSIVADSPDHHRDVVEVLVAFIRQRTPRVPGPDPPQAPTTSIQAQAWLAGRVRDLPEEPAPDVQAALTVLGRRPRHRRRQEPEYLDLRGLHLAQADLSGVDLTDAWLYEADLTDAWLYEADLTGARLAEANLTGARLDGVRGIPLGLTRARLAGATGVPAAWLGHGAATTAATATTPDGPAPGAPASGAASPAASSQAPPAAAPADGDPGSSPG